MTNEERKSKLDFRFFNQYLRTNGQYKNSRTAQGIREIFLLCVWLLYAGAVLHEVRPYKRTLIRYSLFPFLPSILILSRYACSTGERVLTWYLRYSARAFSIASSWLTLPVPWSKGPLYGRQTDFIKVEPFMPSVIKEIIADHNPDYTNDDLLSLWYRKDYKGLSIDDM